MSRCWTVSVGKYACPWSDGLSPTSGTQTQVGREIKFYKIDPWPPHIHYDMCFPNKYTIALFKKKKRNFPFSIQDKGKDWDPRASHMGEGLVCSKTCFSHLSHLLAGETGTQTMVMGGMDHTLLKDWKTALYFKLKLLPNPKYWTWLPTGPLSSSFPV